MAASGVNVKMGVSGVSQFKQSMSQAKQAVKTLDAQLALSEKQFKASGDAEGYMTEKTELLKAKLEQQKKVADNAQKALDDMTKNGVDRASKAYQDMYRSLLQAKGELIDTENALNGVTAAGDEAADSVSDMSNQLDNINTNVSLQNVTNGIGEITGAMETAFSKALKLGAAITREVLGAGSWADDLQTRAKYYGLDQDTLQRMDKTSALIDTSVDAIINAQKKLRKGIGSADQGVMGAFAALFGEGYDPKRNGWEQAFWDAGEAIMKFTDEEEKEVYAQKLFGRSWNELIPLFDAGKQKYEETMAGWHTVSQESVESLGDMDDAYQVLNNEWETFKKELLATFSGPLTQGMETITGLFKELNEYLQTPEGKEMLKQISDSVSSLITDLTNIDPKDVVAGLKSVIDDITNALKWIQEHHQDVVTAMEALLGGWALLKVTGGVLTILEVVKGLQWLKANPNISIPGTGAAAPAAGASGAAAGGSAAGSALAGVKVAVTNTATSFASVAPAIAPVAGVVIDRIMNETNMGRALRDGGDVLEGLKEDIIEKGDEIAHNVETFDQDLRENVLTKDAVNLGTNSVLFWDDFWSKLLTGESGWNWHSAEEDSDWTDEEAQNLTDAIARMTEQIEGGQDTTRQANSELNAATTNLNGLPAVIAAAIESSMSQIKVYIDGYVAGQALGPYLNPGYGGMVMKMTK